MLVSNTGELIKSYFTESIKWHDQLTSNNYILTFSTALYVENDISADSTEKFSVIMDDLLYQLQSEFHWNCVRFSAEFTALSSVSTPTT